MPDLTEYQRVLFAVLKARGPAHPADLAWHPVIREAYGRGARRFDIRDDLEALAEAGKATAYTDEIDGEEATYAYDVTDAERADPDARLQRAKDVVREHRRRRARRKRHGLS